MGNQVTKASPSRLFDELLFGFSPIRTTEKLKFDKLLPKNSLKAYEISAHITWDTAGLGWEQLLVLHKRVAVTETVVHLEYMRWEGEVERITNGESICIDQRDKQTKDCQ